VAKLRADGGLSTPRVCSEARCRLFQPNASFFSEQNAPSNQLVLSRLAGKLSAFFRVMMSQIKVYKITSVVAESAE